MTVDPNGSTTSEATGRRYILVEVLDTRDLSSGRVHTRFLLPDGSVLTHEGCNLDQAGAYEVLEGLDGIEAGAFCERDYPDRAVTS